MKPEKQINGLTFYPVPEFDDASVAFGADLDAYFDRNNLPEIPQKYEDMVNSLFFDGGKIEGLSSEVDKDKAYRAVRAWLCSFAPAHEAKVATVAYALWLWSDDEALSS